MIYSIVFSKSSVKQLKKLDKNTIQRVLSKIEDLSKNPRPIGCKKLEGTKDELWRIRIGEYRVIYSIDDEVKIVDIENIGHRKDIYK
jgi:mRNA interferase RelE/StbE